MRSFTMVRLTLAALVFAAACGGDDDVDPDTTYNCETDDRDEAFTANLERTGAGGVSFTIVEGSPVQLVRGENAWTIYVAKDGAPLTGVDSSLKLTPFMPDHQHGTGVRAIWHPIAGMPGYYDVSPINLWMPGIWEVTIEATPTGAARDSVLFKFCLTA